MKRSFVIITIFFATVSVFAVDFSIGIKGDIGCNKVIEKILHDGEKLNDLDETYKFQFAGKVGAIFGIQFTDVFAFEPEVMVHFGNGESWNQDEGDGINYKGKRSFTTIEFPLMLKVKLGMGSGYLAFAAGPTLNFAVGDVTTKGITTGPDYFDEFEETNTFAYHLLKSFTVGISLGAEYGLPLGPGHLIFGARWELDLSNMADNSDVEDGVKIVTRRMAIMPSVAYMINL